MASRTLAFDLGGLRIWLCEDPETNRNEVNIDEVPGRAEDAIAVRFGTYVRVDNNGRPSPIKISIDELSPGTESGVPAVGGVQATGARRSERLMFEFGQDDDPSAVPGAYRMDIFDQEMPVGQETDAGERRMLTLSKAKGLELYVPLNAYAGGRSGPVTAGSIPHQFETDHAKYVINWQDDADADGKPRGICYNTIDPATGLPTTDASKWTPVGKVVIGPL